VDIPCGCTNCFRQRLASAESLVLAGAWASGHAIAGGMLDCARHSGCEVHADCAAAASSFIADIRRRLTPDAALRAAG
jgi:hypothetical protein